MGAARSRPRMIFIGLGQAKGCEGCEGKQAQIVRERAVRVRGVWGIGMCARCLKITASDRRHRDGVCWVCRDRIGCICGAIFCMVMFGFGSSGRARRWPRLGADVCLAWARRATGTEPKPGSPGTAQGGEYRYCWKDRVGVQTKQSFAQGLQGSLRPRHGCHSHASGLVLAPSDNVATWHENGDWIRRH